MYRPHSRARTALITGVNGQDGSYLAEMLLERGYDVIGVARSPQPPKLAALFRLTSMYLVDLMHPETIGQIIREVKPNEVYYLAAHHYSSQTEENRMGRLDPFLRVNLIAPNSVLEAIAEYTPETRLFYAASAHIYGTRAEQPQNEDTPHRPETPYALSKSAALHLCRHYRETYGVFACAGIMYNHESPRRGPTFVTSRIARAAALASLERPEQLEVHNMGAIVDWGHASDYVLAMWNMLQQESPDDFVVASGAGRTVGEFAEAAFASVGLKSDALVVQDSSEPEDAKWLLIGDSSRLRRATRWQPQINFETMVKEMVLAQREALVNAEKS